VPDDPLVDYYFADPRVVLVPVEHLGDDGMSPAFAAAACTRAGWTPAHVALFDEGWRRYWTRAVGLARRTPTWPMPRRRHVAVVGQPLAVRPYVQLLNTGAWLVYESDVDPATSDPEFFAYVLALGDRMAATGEVTMAAAQAGAWWLERDDAACAAFTAAAARSTRPDAEAFVAVADALPWLRTLRHETLRPSRIVVPGRPIPGTGLFVPRTDEAGPPALVATWTRVATRVVAAYRAGWRRSDPAAVTAACDWLATDAPPVLVAAHGGQILWDPETPTQVGTVRAALKRADAAGLDRIRTDLARVAAITRQFRAAVVDPSALPPPAPNTFQTGYTYLHASRAIVVYDLDEPGMERLTGPALPYEHLMVGARTAHEWAHLADAGGCVPRIASPEAWASLRAELAAALEEAVAAAPAALRRCTAPDLAALADGRPLGVAMGRLLVTRMPDYRANLIARRLMTDAEAETYARHNVRALRAEYPPERTWRLVLRYLFEYQYLQPALDLTRMADPRTVFLATTGAGEELLASGVLDEARFDALTAIVGRLCAAYAIDPATLRFA
jgi:hypothetical protein